MKTVFATIAVLISLLGARLTAADPAPVNSPLEQQYQQVDAQLAMEHYKKLGRAEFDIELKLQTEAIQSEDHRKHLEVVLVQLKGYAEELRIEMIKKEAVAIASAR